MALSTPSGGDSVRTRSRSIYNKMPRETSANPNTLREALQRFGPPFLFERPGLMDLAEGIYLHIATHLGAVALCISTPQPQLFVAFCFLMFLFRIFGFSKILSFFLFLIFLIGFNLF